MNAPAKHKQDETPPAALADDVKTPTPEVTPVASGVTPAILGVLRSKYPQHARAIDGGVKVHGAPVISRVSRVVEVLEASQKYCLSDGTILPLEVT